MVRFVPLDVTAAFDSSFIAVTLFLSPDRLHSFVTFFDLCKFFHAKYALFPFNIAE